jgi:hypothetical protein
MYFKNEWNLYTEWLNNMSKIKQITLDGVAADRITVLNLKEYRSYLKKELKDWKKNPKTDSNPNGYWLHPEDVAGHIQAIEALNLIIKHFGEE